MVASLSQAATAIVVQRARAMTRDIAPSPKRRAMNLRHKDGAPTADLIMRPPRPMRIEETLGRLSYAPER
jgi:hypothetical protein